MKKMSGIFFVGCLAIFLLLNLSGCMEVLPLAGAAIGGGGLISSQESSADQDTLQLQEPLTPSSFVDGALVVGKNLGYETMNVDRRNGKILFFCNSNAFASSLLGKHSNQSVSVDLQNGGKEIDISITASGNFGKGTPDAVKKNIKDFKESLAKQFVTNMVAQNK